jgi:1-deoxy-D-xylulose-5-phosphate reductoisomerase
VLNAANEEAVAAFLDRRLDFLDIPGVIERVLSAATISGAHSLAEIAAADEFARRTAREQIAERNAASGLQRA